MNKTDSLEILDSFTLSCVELVIDGLPYTLVDIDMQTICGPQSPPQTKPTIRLRIEVLETLISDLTRALQIARAQTKAPTGFPIQ